MTYDLNASVDLLMSVVEVERVLCVVLDFTQALRLPTRVVIVAWLEIVVVFLLIVGHVASHRRLHQGTLQ